jgi:hypothetical protein
MKGDKVVLIATAKWRVDERSPLPIDKEPIDKPYNMSSKWINKVGYTLLI